MSPATKTTVRSCALLPIVLAMACGGGESAVPPPPEVTVAQPIKRQIRPYTDFTGTTRAVESAKIQARVSGVLERQLFSASDVVQAGQVLFIIEQAEYAAVRDEALAMLQAAVADSALKESDLERIQIAIETNAVSRQDLDRAQAQRDAAVAAVIGARARLARAQLDFDYTEVRSPITGQVGRRLVDPGNLVGQGEATVLTTVNQLQPIHVYFDAPEWVVLRIIRAMQEQGQRETGRPGETIGDQPGVVRVLVGTAADGAEFPFDGIIDFIGNTVDPGTGTIELRAIFNNEDFGLFPGLFVRVRVMSSDTEDALLVQETAVGTDLGGKYLYLVGEDKVVQQRYVQLGQVQPDGTVSVEGGLDGDETYIVNGLLRARPGFPVTPRTEQEMAQRQAEMRSGAGSGDGSDDSSDEQE
jgi:RND family efflux transporter MFP subunit